MKTNMMRAPLIKSAIVLLIFVLLAYLTSSSPEGGVLNSVGLIIIGAFRLVQWAIAMAIGLAVCIAFLIGIFLFAVSLVNKETAASMYEGVKCSISELCCPLFSCLGSFQCKDAPCAPAHHGAGLKDELQTIIAGEVKKVADNQQALNDQFAALNTKIQALEVKSNDFAAAGQLEAIAGEINSTVQQLQAITPEKMLGDLPARLEKLEQKGEGFDPKLLTESIETLQREVEEMKKKGAGNNPKTKRKA